MVKIYVYANGRYIGRLAEGVTLPDAIRALGPYVRVWESDGIATLDVWALAKGGR